MPASVFSNHAGTMSESFVIGKRGVKLLQGIGDPTGIPAPVGSLYFRRDGIAGFYQMSSGDQWVRLLTPDSITYVQSFTNSDLVSGVLTATHGLSTQFPNVQVWNDSNTRVEPSAISSNDTSYVVVDLAGFGVISGTWHVRVSL
jgi:hypothetical protein